MGEGRGRMRGGMGRGKRMKREERGIWYKEGVKEEEKEGIEEGRRKMLKKEEVEGGENEEEGKGGR